MPTLKDFSGFCTIARLNIQKPEAIDHQAINQITSQIAALLVSPYEIKDKDYYTFNFSYTSNPNIHFPINVIKYLFCKIKTNQNNITICFFIINDCEEINSKIWKLFLHKYQQIDEKSQINRFLQLFQLENVHRQTIIDLEKLNSHNQIFSANFHPYITAIPLPAKSIILDIDKYKQEEIVAKLSRKFRGIFEKDTELEFKSRQSIIFDKNYIEDDEQKFVVKKGI